jgi:hypothetical protein
MAPRHEQGRSNRDFLSPAAVAPTGASIIPVATSGPDFDAIAGIAAAAGQG